ncbi:MAG: hypothetical protein EOO41_04010 [Methanobacteriota archaeon]|nr:MAG: hypothetical protein EOO41_04010 [Euryarchaeota archaeon]
MVVIADWGAEATNASAVAGWAVDWDDDDTETDFYKSLMAQVNPSGASA